MRMLRGENVKKNKNNKKLKTNHPGGYGGGEGSGD